MSEWSPCLHTGDTVALGLCASRHPAVWVLPKGMRPLLPSHRQSLRESQKPGSVTVTGAEHSGWCDSSCRAKAGLGLGRPLECRCPPGRAWTARSLSLSPVGDSEKPPWPSARRTPGPIPASWRKPRLGTSSGSLPSPVLCRLALDSALVALPVSVQSATSALQMHCWGRGGRGAGSLGRRLMRGCGCTGRSHPRTGTAGPGQSGCTGAAVPKPVISRVEVHETSTLPLGLEASRQVFPGHAGSQAGLFPAGHAANWL